MKTHRRITQFANLVLLAVVLAGGVGSRAVVAEDAGEDARPTIRIGQLIYGDVAEQSDGTRCFSPGFLATVARETGTPIHRELLPVAMDSEEIFAYPFLVLAGDGAMALSDAERENLGRYIQRGGFVLASASCSNEAWAASFRSVMGELFETPLEPIDRAHPVFHSLYDIEQVRTRRPGVAAVLYGLTLEGTLRVVFSPTGLNDTDNASQGCCCCGGNEIRNARQINANLLVYALTR